ncbi:MAG: hypothetical protein WD275_09035 [Rhodothermales bacterium]
MRTLPPIALVFTVLLFTGCSDSPEALPKSAAGQAAATSDDTYPDPDSGATLRSYADALNAEGFDVEVMTERLGGDGHFVEQDVLFLGGASLEDGYAIAFRLFKFPPAFDIPAVALDTLQSNNNPDAPEYVWEDNLSTMHDSAGAVTAISR